MKEPSSGILFRFSKKISRQAKNCNLSQVLIVLVLEKQTESSGCINKKLYSSLSVICYRHFLENHTYTFCSFLMQCSLKV